MLLFPDEVLVPNIAPGMEKADNLAALGVNARQIRTFEVVAVKTGECQILGLGRAPVRLGDDVIKLEWRAHKCFGDQAIFTAVAGALADELLKGCGNPHESACWTPKESRAFDFTKSMNHPISM
jgi:hypothetical protein